MTTPPQGVAVLVVADDAEVRRSVTASLQPAGFRLATASDALTGLTVVRSFRPDLIVLSLGAAGGGAAGFIERLRKLTLFQKIPVLELENIRDWLVNPATFISSIRNAVEASRLP